MTAIFIGLSTNVIRYICNIIKEPHQYVKIYRDRNFDSNTTLKLKYGFILFGLKCAT